MSGTQRPPAVVVGVDGSESGGRALRWAENYARATNSTLRLVTACELPVSYEYDTPEIFAAGERAAAQISEKAAASCSLLADRIDSQVVVGWASHVLVEASRKADLLVVGSRGHSRASGLFMGSVSAACAHRAHCPVVVVP